MAISNTIYAVKGGIPTIGYSANPDFYLLSYDFNSNIGYIEKKQSNSWRLYTRYQELSERFQEQGKKKFYHNDDSLQNCLVKLQELTGRNIAVLTVHQILNLKDAI